ncbi:MAG: glycosyltransferase [Candidatus Omnitrophica bacterium]|nr:glycosyltransferase [Candidatus Omnitrophota bacterium]
MRSVLHLIDQLSIGGAQTHLLALLKAGQHDGRYRPLVCSLTEAGEMGPEIERLGVRVIVLSAREQLRRKQWWTIVARLRALCRQERVSVVQTHLTWSRLLGTPAARLAGVPVVIALEQGDLYTGWPYGWANRIVHRWLTDLVTCSEAMKRWLVEHYHLAPSKITVMPNSVVPEEFAPTHRMASIRLSLGLSETAFVLGTVGTLGTGVRKGVEWCLRATALVSDAVPGCHLLVVGDGPERSRLQGLAHELGLEGRVHFLGSRRDIRELMGAMDIVLLASEFEPFGIVLLEAMAMGKPVVATRTGGIPEVVEDRKTGLLVPPNDAPAMAGAIQRLHGDPEAAVQMGREGRWRVERLFTAQRGLAALYELYDRRLAGQGTRP